MPDRLMVGFVDDHPLILHGFVPGLQQLIPELTGAVTVSSVVELLADAAFDELDVVVLDLDLRDGSPPEDNVAQVVGTGRPVLLYTQETRAPVIQRCLKAGASGIVGKHEDVSVLAAAIRQLAAGEPVLTTEWASAVQKDIEGHVPDLAPREREALRLYAAGLPLKSVARRMEISADTAKEYLLRVRRKYAGVDRPAPTKAELYQRAVEDGYLPPAEPRSHAR